MQRMDDILRTVADFFDRPGSEYVLIGGIVVSIHGVPRTTMDADIIIRLDGRGLSEFVGFLRKSGFLADLDDAKCALDEHSHFSAQDGKSILRLDVKGSYNEMDKRTLERRVPFNFRGTRLWIETAEDLIANKLVYGSDQDIRDAEGVFLTQKGKLDMDYLRLACKLNGVTKKFRAMTRRLEKDAPAEGDRMTEIPARTRKLRTNNR